MEFKSVVYNAARDGKVSRLRIFLDNRPKEEVQKLIHAKTNGATPLIAASRNGHSEVVEYLVKHCRAELEQVGQVTFDGETIEGAPPLWCAAAAGHFEVAKFLIEGGAGVNSTTLTNSTPLRAACFDGHFEIVKYLVERKANIEIANRHGHTCLMISCYKGHYKIVKFLLSLGADVNRKSVKGNTALHDCAESGSVEIMKLLLSHDARMDKDAYGMTPLLAASVTGQTKVVEYLLTRSDIAREEKIDALELLGATYVDKKRDMLGALQYWRMALDERHRDHKSIIPKPTTDSVVAAYENAVEVKTYEELDELISDPDDMRMQALLVRERILGPAHPDTSYYIRYRGAVYADMGNFDRCIVLWMYALDMQQKMLEPLSPMTQSSFLSFAELFSFWMSDGRGRPAHPVEFNDIMSVFEKGVAEIEHGMAYLAKLTPEEKARMLPSEKDGSHFNRTLTIMMHLVCLMSRMKKKLSPEQEFSFKKSIYKLVQLKPRGQKGQTPLHLACSKDTTTVGRYPVCSFPSAEVANLLMEVGASLEDVDVEGNTALHIAAANKPCKLDVMRVLLNHGAHLDMCNASGRTPMQLMKNATIGDVCSPLEYISLQCLAAKVIRTQKLPYKGHVPAKLEDFVEKH
ncbi:protein fem-1 homolog C-like [Lingula anatina]|uniref:Protein fem-1 homolog C-like n=1 Tax=Lingula anatina TaxID=7574 RepID=A0A1S3IJB5_LINAN|nr:protein fem-1 homolog C-like [Lingula anatina]|eukprot:XP_013398307.1 protein fem-1 homolog C-like [Lingula anatina]